MMRGILLKRKLGLLFRTIIKFNDGVENYFFGDCFGSFSF